MKLDRIQERIKSRLAGGLVVDIDIPDLDAVEMEGAAIAQIATQEKIPWAIVRVISDSANEEASEDFSTFIKQYENHSWEIINCLLNQIHDDKILSTL